VAEPPDNDLFVIPRRFWGHLVRRAWTEPAAALWRL